MSKRKKGIQAILGLAGALSLGGCAFNPAENIQGEVYGPPPDDIILEQILETKDRQTEEGQSEDTSADESVPDMTDDLDDFDAELNINACVYGPPEMME